MMCPWILLGFLLLTAARCSIPAKQDGFWFQRERAEDKSVLIEAFFDPVCPDSRDSWPPLRKALGFYGSLVTLVLHPFPLPYHDNAFVTCQALHVVDDLNTSATYDLLEAFFDNQEAFYNEATSNVSRDDVIDKTVKFVSNQLGTSYNRSAVEEGFLDPKSNQATRVSFKYGCLRGVYGTPFFFVNGFPLPDAGSALDYQGWVDVLDPLVTKRHSLSAIHHPYT